MNSSCNLPVLINRSEIEACVGRLAGEIGRDYRDKNPLIIGVLKGSFIFIADLVRRLDFPLEIDFARLSSYGSGTETSGRVAVVQELCTAVRDRHVLVTEDIIDTGITVSYFMDVLKKEGPDSLRLCTLLDKPSRRRVPVDIDYKGFEIPDKFIVGYGLDCAQKYRNLPDICYLEE